MAPRITREEVSLAFSFTDYAAFRDAYVIQYKDKVPLLSIAKRAYNVWHSKDRIKASFDMADARAIEKAHTLTIPVVIKTKSPNMKPRADLFPDIGEILVKCHNVLVEIASVQKEQLELFRKLSERKSL